MKDIVKNFDRVGLMVLLAAFFVTVGFKAAEKMEEGTWYEVSFINPSGDLDDPSNQSIAGEYPGGEPSGDCSFSNATICAVKLLIEDGSSVPATMLEALNRQSAPNSDLEIQDEKHKR